MLIKFLAYLILVLLPSQPPQIRHGYAARYRSGLMSKVARNRGMDPSHCMIASHISPLGSWVKVSSRHLVKPLVCQVVDIAPPSDRAWNLEHGRIIEVAYENALEICGSTRSRPIDCPVTVAMIK